MLLRTITASSLLLSASFFCMPAQVAIADTATEANPLRVGSISPLSGDFAKAGSEVREGVELAVEDLRTRGIFLKAIFEDGCLPADVVRISKKLIQVDRIQSIAASYCVIGTTAAASVFETAKIPFFHTSPVSDSIVNSGEFIFTTNVVIRDEARRAAEYVRKTLDAKSIFLLSLETQWGEDFGNYFSRTFEELGGEVLGRATAPIGTHDFRSELTKARSTGAQVIFAAHAGLMLGNILKQAKQLGVTAQFIAPDEAEDPTVVEVAGDSAEGLMMLSPAPDHKNSTYQLFRERFFKKFKKEPTTLSTNSYDATILIGESFKACGENSECIQSTLYSVHNYPGVSGIFSIQKDGGTQKPFRVRKVSHGQFVDAA